MNEIKFTCYKSVGISSSTISFLKVVFFLLSNQTLKIRARNSKSSIYCEHNKFFILFSSFIL